MPSRAVRTAALAAAALLVGAPCLGGRCLLAGRAAAEEEKKAEEKTEQKGAVHTFGTYEARTNIVFESEADLETIHGTTHSISGSARLDAEAGTGQAKLSVPVRSMRTGIDLRDEHLRSDAWMDAAKYPDIGFMAQTLKRKAKDSDDWEYDGKVTIHGVTRDLKGTARVKFIPAKLAEKFKLGAGDWVKVATDFKVTLSDFGIKIPEGLVQGKVSATWTIKVDIFGTTQPPK